MTCEQTLELHVEGVESACGESDVHLNRQKLPVQWDGDKGYGHGLLETFGQTQAFWNVVCLYNSDISTEGSQQEEDVIHLLRLRFEPHSSYQSPGFTISYKQKKSPSIVRFSPSFIEFESVEAIAGQWRSPSLTFDHDPYAQDGVDGKPDFGANRSHQKSLGSSIQEFSQAVRVKFGSAINQLRLCFKKHSGPQSTLMQDKDAKALHDELEGGTPASESLVSTNTTPSSSAAETRSLTNLDSPSESYSGLPSTSSSPVFLGPNYQPLKIFGISLILLSLLVWLLIIHRDPRRRADRAARREERRTRRLYRRAARRQKIKTWFWNVRMRYRLASKQALEEDEKQARVKEQEHYLANFANEDVRALRNAHRVVSNITAAEEGRNYFEYEASNSRRRSVSTLPGYENESSQPPSYDESGRLYNGSTLVRESLVGGSTFTLAENDSDPDSSVVSTSPRISRDGTNSDFDEKIEIISLEPQGMAEAYRVNHRS